MPLERAGVIAAAKLMRAEQSRNRTGTAYPEGPTGGAPSARCAQPLRPAESTLIGVGAERFRQWVHAAEQEAGLGRVWPHLLRHAASTRVARSSDPETWRRFMNHADLSQWARYVAGTDERVRAAVPTP